MLSLAIIIAKFSDTYITYILANELRVGLSNGPEFGFCHLVICSLFMLFFSFVPAVCARHRDPTDVKILLARVSRLRVRVRVRVRVEVRVRVIGLTLCCLRGPSRSRKAGV